MTIRWTSAAVMLTVSALAQPAKLPNAEEVLKNMERVFAPVQDFTVNVVGDVDMENIRVPRTTATMYFKRPDKVHFVSPRFSIIPREGMSPNPERIRNDYDATTIGWEDLDGRRVLKLQLAARNPKVRLRQAFLWVDPSNWTLAKLTSMPYEGRTLSLEFEQSLVNGSYWLPSKLKALFGSVGEKADPMFKTPEGAPNPAPQFEEMQRSLRSGAVTFTYSGYRVNIGIPDSVFVPEERR
jgi:outer membrane lipoprotein-sorting protein